MRAKKIEWLIEIKTDGDPAWQEMDRRPTLKAAKKRVADLLEWNTWSVRLIRCRVEYKEIKTYEGTLVAQ